MDANYLDFKKSFDAVAHERFVITLRGLGISGTGNLLNWIRDFLFGRNQRVVLDGTSSEWEVTSGVPQGSVLGPTLFVAAIQSLSKGIASAIMIYADDTKMYLPVSTEEDAGQLQSDLDTLFAWSNK